MCAKQGVFTTAKRQIMFQISLKLNSYSIKNENHVLCPLVLCNPVKSINSNLYSVPYMGDKWIRNIHDSLDQYVSD